MSVSEPAELEPDAPPAERRQRADAARNRQRLLDAASELFGERGIDVGVSEIADRAGIGRATLFRNFPTKHDLVVAIVIERMHVALHGGRELLANGEPRGELVATFLTGFAAGQRLDRVLFEAIGAEEFLNNAEARLAHTQIVELLDGLLRADHAAGTVRGDVSALDVLLLIKGACAIAASFTGEEGARALSRQLTLVRSALSSAAQDSCPFAGPALTLEEFTHLYDGTCSG